MRKRKIGQITIKKVGNKYAVCISGNPVNNKLYSPREAENEIKKLRHKYGRRHYKYLKKRKR